MNHILDPWFVVEGLVKDLNMTTTHARAKFDHGTITSTLHRHDHLNDQYAEANSANSQERAATITP